MDIRQENIDRLDSIINESLVVRDGVPLPSIIEISPVDFCTRDCLFCPRSSDIAPDNLVQMSFELIKHINDDLKEMGFNGLITLCGFGEPMLYKDLYRAVELLSKSFKVDLITNGDLLNEESADRLIFLGLNRLLISVYEESDLSWIEASVKNVPKDKLTIRLRYDKLVKDNRAGTMPGQSGLSGPCHYLSYHMMIDWNGDVVMCPQDWNRHIKFGNIANQKLFDIWKSSYMNRVRKGLFIGRSHSPCNKCDTDGTLHGNKHKEIWCR